MSDITLKQRLATGGIVQAPGAYDGLTAKLIEEAGFEAVYMTGYGTAAASGMPDIGLLTMTEMVTNAARIAEAVKIPVISDADTGYGNEVNVGRTVREFEKAGVAAIHLEDQTWPKRCGHMAGKTLIDCDDMVQKIKAAVDARQRDEFLIIARTDANAVEGFDCALERGARYGEAGADILFIEAPLDKQQLADIPKRLPDWPHVVNLAPQTPPCSVSELEGFGFALAIYPGICLTATLAACREELQDLKDTGSQRNLGKWLEGFEATNRFLGA